MRQVNSEKGWFQFCLHTSARDRHSFITSMPSFIVIDAVRVEALPSAHLVFHPDLGEKRDFVDKKTACLLSSISEIASFKSTPFVTYLLKDWEGFEKGTVVVHGND